jgi:alkylation response protein AidB-like acyl-CoA dehydrogenase
MSQYQQALSLTFDRPGATGMPLFQGETGQIFDIVGESLSGSITHEELTALRLAGKTLDDLDNRRWPNISEFGVWGRLQRTMLTTFRVPTELGGEREDIGLTELSAIGIRTAAYDPSVALTLAGANLACTAVALRGSSHQKTRFFEAVMRGEPVAWAYTAPDSGSSARWFGASFKKEGAKYLLNGSRGFVTNAPTATWVVFFANNGAGRLTAFLLERARHGFWSSSGYDKTGMRLSPTGDITADGVECSDEDVLGEVDNAWEHVLETLIEGRVFIASIALGLNYLVEELAIRHLAGRDTHGGKLIDLKGVQDDLHILRRMRGMTEQAVAQIPAIGLFSTTKQKVQAATEIKIRATDCSRRAASWAMDFFGAVGFDRRAPFSDLESDARVLVVGEGSNRVLKRSLERVPRLISFCQARMASS